jgi:transglutaminase-like putative cysteine protease
MPTASRTAIGWFIALCCLAPAVPAADRTVDPKDVVRQLLVASPYRISGVAREGTIRYRIRAQPASWAWPETAEQHVVRDGDDLVELTVCRTCGDEAAPSSDALHVAQAPGAWVESSDPRIMAFARGVRGGSVESRMRRLVIAVQQQLSGPVDFDAYRTARQAYDERGGDCTEFALLLAAAARADGIPTRVVAGLAYASRFAGRPHAFVPHMWVQAWDGRRWTSYDAGLGAFDSGHIALALGDGSPASLQGALDVIRGLRIENAEGVLASTPSAGR